eukprot:14764027-Alexandrium_andersonii.AAC.1
MLSNRGTERGGRCPTTSHGSSSCSVGPSHSRSTGRPGSYGSWRLLHNPCMVTRGACGNPASRDPGP